MKRNLTQFVLGLIVGGGLLYLLSTGSCWQLGVLPNDRREELGSVEFRHFGSQNKWTLQEHRGKVVLINYWATWCPPCRYETPSLVRIFYAYQGKPFEIVGVTVDDDLSQVADFVERYSIPYPILLPGVDPNVKGGLALPTTFLYDKQGRLAKRYTGVVFESTLRSDIEALLMEE